MIGALRGVLFERDARGTVIVEAGGVGYEVHVTGPTSAGLGEIGSDVVLRIHTRVREDAITLYGFVSAEEKSCFEALIAAHGVGPAMALSLLTMHSPVGLRQIVALEDADALAQVPGIGKKTAARLLIELKAKFEFDGESIDLAILSAPNAPVGDRARADVTVALSGLGYGADEIRKVMSGLPQDGTSEELLRMALRELAVAS